MAELQIQLLGSFNVIVDGSPVPGFHQPRLQSLLAYLLLNRQGPQARQSIAFQFWPDSTDKQARSNLRRLLYSLRRSLPDADNYLEVTTETLHWRSEGALELDAARFEQNIAKASEAGHQSEPLDALQEAAAAYGGDLLPGLYEEWVLVERERLRALYLGVLTKLATLFEERREYSAAIEAAQRSLNHDPLQESSYRQLMRLYLLNEDRGSAIAAYHRCVIILQEELGVDPSPLTKEIAYQAGYTDDMLHKIKADDGRLSSQLAVLPALTSAPNIDRRDAPEIATFFGRDDELAQLESWILTDRCRLVSILGMGGQGKTALAAKFTHNLVEDHQLPPFSQILWRSLLNAPPLAELLPEILGFLSRQQIAELPPALDQRLDLLLDLLRRQRCLLILDNAESLLQEGEKAGVFRDGYEDYGQLFYRVGQHNHQSCMLLTSREALLSLQRLGQNSPQVRLLKLEGLAEQGGRQLLQQHGLVEEHAQLVERYSGNPLALKLVADTVENLFFGDASAFLADETLIFDDIRTVLRQQVDRLSQLEQDILTWLAIEREPVTPEILEKDLVQQQSRRAFLEALRALQRRSLLEKGGGGFILQNVVTEYLTDRLNDQVCEAIENGQVEDFNRHALLKAQAKPYIRESQRRLILGPIARRLLARMGQAGLEDALAKMRGRMRAEMRGKPGYAAGNMLNLLLHIGGDLRNADFSQLAVRQADLQGKTAQDINFRGADFSDLLLTETFNNVSSVAISPDGTLLAAGDFDGRIMIWRLADGSPLAVMRGSNTFIYSLCFTPDSQFLASSGTADVGGIVKLWDAQSGQAIADLPLPRQLSFPWAVAFSPDGRSLACGSSDSYIYLWDVRQAVNLGVSQPSRELYIQEPELRTIAYSPDGKFLAAGDIEGAVHLWELESSRLLTTLTEHRGLVLTVTFSPDGTFLASGAADHTVKLWDVAGIMQSGTTQSVQTLLGHSDWVRAIGFHPDSAVLASAAEDGSLRLWDVYAGQVICILHGHTRRKVTSVCYHPNGDLLASGGDDQSVRLWDVTPNVEGIIRGQNVKTFKGFVKFMWSVAISPDGKTLAGVGDDKTIWLWDMAQLLQAGDLSTRPPQHGLAGDQPFMALTGHSDSLLSVHFNPTGNILASGSWDKTIKLWDARSGRLLHTLRGHTSDIWRIRFSPDGSVLASGSEDGTIRLWDVHSGQTIRILSPDNNDAFSPVAFSRDGRTLASVNSDSTICLWDVAGGQLINTLHDLPGECHYVAFSPDGRILAAAFSDDTIRLWRFIDPASMRADQAYKTFWGPTYGIGRFAFSPDSRQLAGCSMWQGENIIYLIDIASPGGKDISPDHHILGGHAKPISQVAFHPTGRTLASCSFDGLIRLWDLAERTMIKEFKVDRPYERMDISGVTGLTDGQKESLKALGAVENYPMF